MPLSLSIFGISNSGLAPVFCYAFLRLIRGSGEYPPPSLSENRTVPPERTPIESSNLELVAWDTTFDDEAATNIRLKLDQGQFAIPTTSPIEPGRTLLGDPFGPVLIADRFIELRVSGTGVLSLKGSVVSNAVSQVIQTVREAVGEGEAPTCLNRLMTLIAEQSGENEFFTESRRLGVIDHFYRPSAGVGDATSILEPVHDLGLVRY
jgi:hypothetical protein